MRLFYRNSAILAILVVLFAFGFEYYLTKVHFNNWKNVSIYQKDFWLVTQKNTDWDMAVLGTSRAYHTVNPKSMNAVNPKLRCINLGTDGTSHADHYLYLHQFLNNGNTMDTLLLEIDEFTLSGWMTNTVPFKDYVFAVKYGEEPYNQTYRDYFDRKKYYLWKFPLVKYVEYNSYYNLNPFKKDYEDRFQSELGFIEAFSTGFTKNFNSPTLELKQHHFDLEYIQKILDLAREKGIVTYLFTAPVQEQFFSIEKNRESSMDTIRSIAKRNKLKYFDMSNIPGLTDTSYFSDYTHLNRKGANKFSEILYNKVNGK